LSTIHLLLFVRCDTIRPVTRMNSVVRHQVVSDGVSSQLVKLHVLVMPFSVLEHNDFMDPVILRSAWFSVLEYNDFMDPVILRSAWFWVLSELSRLSFADVAYADELYSSLGLTVPW